MSKRRLILFRCLAVCIPSLITLCAVEAVYRVYRYKQLCAQIAFPEEGTDPAGCDVFDPELGYRYRPHKATYLPATEPGQSPRIWRVNSHGHIADSEYPLAKPPGELRIAAIGDSFTAGITNSVRWTSVLEERLNQNPTWTGAWKKTTRVINLGHDAMGVVQFQAVFDREAPRFEPDIILVSLIIDDLRRRRYWRGEPERAEDRAPMQEFLRQEMLGPLPWYGLHCEVLAASKVGRPLGMRPRLVPRDYHDADEAMAVSLASLRHMVKQHPRVLILHHPMYEEYGRGLDHFRAGLKEQLYRDGADLEIVRMQDVMPDPKIAGVDPITAWYQRPSDTHPTDAGMVLYGEAVETVLLNWLQANSAQAMVGK